MVENLITSNIRPRPGPNLFQVTEVPFCGRVVIVVEVESGVGEVWQAKDRKYYKRFHYKVEPMTHDEINEVRRRKARPDLRLVFGFDERWRKTLMDDRQELVTIYVGIQNDSDVSAEFADLELGISRVGYLLSDGGQFPPAPFEHAGTRTVKGMAEDDISVDWYKVSWPSQNPTPYAMDGPIYRTIEPRPLSLLSIESPFSKGLTPYNLGLKYDVVKGWLFWRIQAPGTVPAQGVTEVIQERRGLGLRLREPDKPFDIL